MVSWTGGTSFWDLATNWSSNPLLPGAADDVLIDVAGVQTVTHRSGTNTISSFALTGDDFFTLSGGSLTVANAFGSATLTNLSGGTLTLNGTSSMAALTQGGGVLGGTGTLSVAGPVHLARRHPDRHRDDAVRRLPGAERPRHQGDLGRAHHRSERHHHLERQHRRQQRRDLVRDGGTLNNHGTFNDQNAFASFIDHSSGSNTFNNPGTYNKQSNTVTTVEALFHNTGTTNVNAGTMLLQGGSGTEHRHVEHRRRRDARVQERHPYPRQRRRPAARAPSWSAPRTSARTPSSP